MLHTYGDEAVLEAAQLVDRLLAAGDIEGFHHWKAVTQALRNFLQPGAGPVN
jgi:hypothetical protein